MRISCETLGIVESVPSVFGFPLWVGLKRRVAKKNLRRDRDFRRRLLEEMAPLKVGDLVQTCTGLNARIVSVEPAYRNVGRRGGKVLFDLDFETSAGSCSFHHCGVGRALTYAEAEEYRDWLVKTELAKGDPHGFAARYSREAMTIHPDGTFSRKVP